MKQERVLDNTPRGKQKRGLSACDTLLFVTIKNAILKMDTSIRALLLASIFAVASLCGKFGIVVRQTAKPKQFECR